MDPAKPPGNEATYVWKIENFSMCPQAKEECLKSNPFSVDSMEVSEFQLVLYPRGRWYAKDDTALCLLQCRQESDFQVNVAVTFTYEDVKIERKKENVVMKNGETIGFPVELRKRSLVAGRFALLPGEVFTVSCTITPIYREPLADILDLKTLSEDLGRLHQMGLFSDFYLVDQENRKFPVHKVILSMRCRELAEKVGIFDREDRKWGELDLVSGEVLEVFLHYVYTGRLRENLPCDLLNEVYNMAEEYAMDDLKRDLFPLELCKLGRTVIKVDHHEIKWCLVDFHERVETGEWPVRTFLDLVIGRFVASFSVLRDGDTGETFAQVGLECQCLNLDRALVMKCVVEVLTPDEESRVTFCSGEHRFDAENTERFVMKGDCTSLYKYKEFPALVFDIQVSNPRSFERCNTVEVVNAIHTPHPLWNRSLLRLSSDLDVLFNNTTEDEPATYSDTTEDGFATYSDLKVVVQGDCESTIPVHRCVLASRSGHLMSMIIGNAFLERTAEIRMPGMKHSTVRHILRYVYSGKIPDDLTFLEVVEVYVNAGDYQLGTLCSRCLTLMNLKVQLEDLLMVMKLSEDLNDMHLLSVAVSFIRRKRDLVLNSKEWVKIEEKIPSRAALALSYADSLKMDF